MRKLICKVRYICAEFSARPGDELVVGEDITEAKAVQALRDFPMSFEEVSETDDGGGSDISNTDDEATTGEDGDQSDSQAKPEKEAGSKRKKAK